MNIMSKQKSVVKTWSLLMLLFMLACHHPDSAKVAETGTITWPEITQESKPWIRWWWHGSAVNEPDLTAALEAYQKTGLGGVEITPIYGVRGAEDQFLDFLSPEWMEKLVYTLAEAKRLGLGVDLANASGWPFGGPWIGEEAACKNIVARTFEIEGGATLTKEITCLQTPLVRTQGRLKVGIDEIKEPLTANDNLQEYAFDQVRYEKDLPLLLVTANKRSDRDSSFSETIDLTGNVKDGILEWAAPEGDWLVCALFQGDHGKMVERAGPGGEGNVIDHFSAEALEVYLRRFDEAFAGYDLSYLRYYFNDSYEVDDAVGESNWTPELFSEFKRMHGYDLTKHIPALLSLDDAAMNGRVIYDFRQTFSELLLERYTKNWQRWAAKQGKGIRNQSHGSPANVLDLYAASDVPEIEGNTILHLKSAPSAAHVTGKKWVSSESATWLNEHFQSNWGDVKTVIDKFLLAGVNHVFYHGTTYSPQDAAWPGWLFYAAVHFTPANSLWDDLGAFNRYVARSQSFLQAGKPSNDLLLYYGMADVWSRPGKATLHHYHSFDDVSMKECGQFLLENGYSWDAFSDKQLLDVTYKHSNLMAGGNTYRAIVVPEMERMPVETFDQLLKLANAGATVLFYKKLPVDVPGLAHLQQRQERLEALVGKLSFVEEQACEVAAYGKGKIVVADGLPALLENAEVQPEGMYAQGLQCIRREKPDGSFYYFISNPTKRRFAEWIELNVNYTSAALYNPMTEKSGWAKTRKDSDKREVYLQLKPNESLIVETFRGDYSGGLYPYYQSAGEKMVLTDRWNIAFVKGGPTLPQPLTVSELKSWTEYGGDYTVFSGTAEYSTQIPTVPTADAWQLELENVNESAAVYINNEYVGTLFNAPYTVEIPGSLLKGSDELKIKVSNLMANRIADMDKKGIEWRIFYNTNVNARKKENVGKDGKFTAANWSPKNSGMSGAVTLTPLTALD